MQSSPKANRRRVQAQWSRWATRSVVTIALLLASGVPAASAPGDQEPVVVPEVGRSPYAIMRESIAITVGATVSRVEGTYQFIYVRDYDSEDKLDPVLIDVPVIVRAEDTGRAKVLQITEIQLQIGRRLFLPRDVLLLDPDAYEPVPWLPAGARIALVSFNIPRESLKLRFRARITYDQPNLPAATGGEICAFLPVLPDYDQLESVLHFKPDDFVVTFTALPGLQLQRESFNAEVTTETPGLVTVRARHRETIAVSVTKAAPVEATAENAAE